MLKVTQQQILRGLARFPCKEYSPLRVADLFNNRASIPVLVALRLPLPPEDLLRAALSYGGTLPDTVRHDLDCLYTAYGSSKIKKINTRSTQGPKAASGRTRASRVWTTALRVVDAARIRGSRAELMKANAWATHETILAEKQAAKEAWQDLLQITINYLDQLEKEASCSK